MDTGLTHRISDIARIGESNFLAGEIQSLIKCSSKLSESYIFIVLEVSIVDLLHNLLTSFHSNKRRVVKAMKRV